MLTHTLLLSEFRFHTPENDREGAVRSWTCDFCDLYELVMHTVSASMCLHRRRCSWTNISSLWRWRKWSKNRRNTTKSRHSCFFDPKARRGSGVRWVAQTLGGPFLAIPKQMFAMKGRLCSTCRFVDSYKIVALLHFFQTQTLQMFAPFDSPRIFLAFFRALQVSSTFYQTKLNLLLFANWTFAGIAGNSR